MRTIEFEISGTLPGLNEYINASRKNKFEAARMKRDAENRIIREVRAKYGRIKLQSPVWITYSWVEPNKRRDKDNIAFAKKFLQDALVKAGVLENDGWRDIAGWGEKFRVDAKKPRVKVIVKEVGRDSNDELIKELRTENIIISQDREIQRQICKRSEVESENKRLKAELRAMREVEQ